MIPRIGTYGMTQKGLTATCPVCDGMGCVIAQEVYDGSRTVMVNVNGGEPKREYVNRLAEVLIPCPGCFSDAAILTIGL